MFLICIELCEQKRKTWVKTHHLCTYFHIKSKQVLLWITNYMDIEMNEKINALYEDKDFISLHALYNENKNPVIALLLADLTYSSNYKTDENPFPTKKALNDFVKKEGMACLREAASSGDLASMTELADAQMYGRAENVNFGSTICNSDLKGGIATYLDILEHPDASDDLKALAHYGIGHMIEIMTRPVINDPLRPHSDFTDHWHCARQYNPNSLGYLFSTLRIAEWYLLESNQEPLAIPLFEEIKDTMPYACAHLALAYQRGAGVDIDNDISAMYFSLWKNRVEDYKLKLGSKKTNTIDIESLLKN